MALRGEGHLKSGFCVPDGDFSTWNGSTVDASD